jgi:hypothetical protein
MATRKTNERKSRERQDLEALLAVLEPLDQLVGTLMYLDQVVLPALKGSLELRALMGPDALSQTQAMVLSSHAAKLRRLYLMELMA